MRTGIRGNETHVVPAERNHTSPTLARVEKSSPKRRCNARTRTSWLLQHQTLQAREPPALHAAVRHSCASCLLFIAASGRAQGRKRGRANLRAVMLASLTLCVSGRAGCEGYVAQRQAAACTEPRRDEFRPTKPLHAGGPRQESRRQRAGAR